MSEELRPYRPIAIGFYLLALPLFVAVFLDDGLAGQITNLIAAVVMLGFGLLLQRRTA